MCISQLQWPSVMEFYVYRLEVSVVLSQHMDLTLNNGTTMRKEEATMHKENPIFRETTQLELNEARDHMTAM